MRYRLVSIFAIALLVMPGCSASPSVPEQHPPAVGQPVVLDSRVPGWETSVWLAENAFCVRAARTDGQRVDGRENESTFCDPMPAALALNGPPLVPAKPLPYLTPLDPQSREVILVGTVRGAVAKVSVTMFEQTATAVVHPLPATAGRQIGAYAVWLPRSGNERNGMNLSDITAVVGHDVAGNDVARLD